MLSFCCCHIIQISPKIGCRTLMEREVWGVYYCYLMKSIHTKWFVLYVSSSSLWNMTVCISLSNQSEGYVCFPHKPGRSSTVRLASLSQTEADTEKTYTSSTSRKAVMSELSLLYLGSSLEIKSSLYQEEKHQDGKISSLDPVDQWLGHLPGVQSPFLPWFPLLYKDCRMQNEWTDLTAGTEIYNGKCYIH